MPPPSASASSTALRPSPFAAWVRRRSPGGAARPRRQRPNRRRARSFIGNPCSTGADSSGVHPRRDRWWSRAPAGQWRMLQSCRGPAGCKGTGSALTCDTGMPQPGEPCVPTTAEPSCRERPRGPRLPGRQVDGAPGLRAGALCTSEGAETGPQAASSRRVEYKTLPPWPNEKTPREILAAAGKLDKDVVAVKLRGRTVDLHTPVDATASPSSRPSAPPTPTASRSSATRPPTSWPTPCSASSRAPRSPSAPRSRTASTTTSTSPAAASPRTTCAASSSAMLEVIKQRHALPPRGRHARRSEADVRGDGRDLQARDHRRHPRGRRGQHLQARRAAERVARRVRGPARARRPGSSRP